MYKLTNGQVEQVTSLPNVSGAELYLQSLPVAERQAMGIFAHLNYGDYPEPITDATNDCIFAPFPVVPDLPAQPFAISKILLKHEMQAVNRWADFKAILAGDPDANEDFELAVVLMSNDKNVIRFRSVCSQAFGFTEQEIDDMLIRCKSDI
jgi:hypothetical protein